MWRFDLWNSLRTRVRTLIPDSKDIDVKYFENLFYMKDRNNMYDESLTELKNYNSLKNEKKS